MAPEKYKKNEIYDIPVGDLVIKPEYQPRNSIDMDKIKELAESIKEKGQQQPILFMMEEDTPVLVAGHRRLMAIKDELKWESIRGILVEGKAQEIALIENVVREDLTPIEESRYYIDLMKIKGFKQKDLAKITGRTESVISDVVNITKKVKPEILEDIQKRYGDRYPRYVLVNCAKMSEKEQNEYYKKFKNGKVRKDNPFPKEPKPVAAHKQAIYIAKAAAAKLKACKPEEYQNKDREVLIKNLKELRDNTETLLAELTAPTGDPYVEIHRNSSDELSA